MQYKSTRLTKFLAKQKGNPTPCLLFLMFLIHFPWLWLRGLQNPDETRYGSIVLEMLNRNDFIVPYLNGFPYLEKPPLMYWLGAISTFIVGPSEGALRLWSFIAGATLVGVTVKTASILYGPQAGFKSGLIALTSFFVVVFSQAFTLDMMVATLISISLAKFIIDIAQNTPQFHKKIFFLFFCGLAILAKGLIGIVLPLLVILMWSILAKRYQALRILLWPPSILLFLLIVLPWHLLVEHKQPGSLDYYIIHEHFQRYTSTIHGRFRGAWFIPLALLIGLMPWTGYWAMAMKSTWSRYRKNASTAIFDLYLLVWIAVIFIFFFFSRSHLAGYLLPLVMPASIITGKLLLDQRTKYENAVGAFFSIMVFLVSSLILILIATNNTLQISTEFFNSLGGWIWLLILTILIAASGFVLFYKQKFGFKLLCMSILPLIICAYLLSYITQYKSLRDLLTSSIKKTDNALIYSYGDYRLDATYYFNQPTVMVDHNGELRFGAQLNPKLELLISKKEFMEMVSNKKPMLVIARENSLPELAGLVIIARKGQFVLLKNEGQ